MAKNASNAVSAVPGRKKRGGIRKMLEEVDKALEIDSEAIAKALAKSSKAGHVQSTRLLIELACQEKESEDDEEPPVLHSQAQKWEAEREWQGRDEEYLANYEDAGD
jgi:hypothetical protein